MIIQPVVPLTPQGFRVDIVSLPEQWIRLSDKAQWDRATQELLRRIGILCQQHIRAIMQGKEPRRDGKTVFFQEATGRGVQAIQWNIQGNSVEIFADDRASYLVYQEHGVSAQPMRWLVGKTIPWVLVKGVRTNPETGTVVQGVTRVKYAGPGSRYAIEASGVIAETPKVGKEALDGTVNFTTITEATFTKPSQFNPTGYRWWLPERKGLAFFKSGILKGLEDVAGSLQGIAFRVAGGGETPEGDAFTPEYQAMLNDLERVMEAEGVFPFNQ